MNNRQNNRRRGRGGGGGGNRPSGMGGNGSRIDNRARGNATQLYEKYKALARDMQTQGDRVMTEYYLQFADHYYRIVNEARSRLEEQQQQRRGRDEIEDDAGEVDMGFAPHAETDDQPVPARPAPVQVDAEEGEARVPRARRGRPRRDESDEGGQIELDCLPPAFSSAPASEDDAQEAAPRRRGRPPKAAVTAEG